MEIVEPLFRGLVHIPLRMVHRSPSDCLVARVRSDAIRDIKETHVLITVQFPNEHVSELADISASVAIKDSFTDRNS